MPRAPRTQPVPPCRVHSRRCRRPSKVAAVGSATRSYRSPPVLEPRRSASDRARSCRASSCRVRSASPYAAQFHRSSGAAELSAGRTRGGLIGVRRALHPRDPDLVALVEGARNSAREAAVFAAETALQRTLVSDHPVPEALNALRTYHTGTAIRLRPELEALVERLDGIYWDLSAASDSKSAHAVREAFARARAVNSLV